MDLPVKWIWLPANKYPDEQATVYSGFCDKTDGNYTVAEFEKIYQFDKKVSKIKLIVSGDTEFRLMCNGSSVATGPAYAGGDFLDKYTVRNDYYAMKTEIALDTSTVSFFARVKMMPTRICEYSKGHGGFMLSALVQFEDGSETTVTTDSGWLVRKNRAYKEPCCYDTRYVVDEYTYAEEIKDIWNIKIAPIAVRKEEKIKPDGNKILINPYDEKEVVLFLDRIYAGFVNVIAKTKGNLFVDITCRELEEEGTFEKFVFSEDDEYTGFHLHSAGNIVVKLRSDSDTMSEIEINLISTFYPADNVGKVMTDDTALNDVLDVCRHTLKICRQLHHLDSPKHCEPLACTGDYYIETLMTLFSFGDMSLSEFDVKRTAIMLENNNGRIFHTTYSLIWVKMLYDVYMFTGNKKNLYECEKALKLLLSRFQGYIGENGLIENPPDYMFVDWIFVDGISMHHPPKALGQTCLNMFYYGALDTAEKIFEEISEYKLAKECENKKTVLKKAINSMLFDEEKGMYFEGLNTETPDELIGNYMPRNVDKRYYMKHSNILAVCFGVCEEDKAESILKKIMSDECPGDVQPYFLHYLLEAVFKTGLQERYTFTILEKWKKPVSNCKKGLVEGFLKPEPTYSFDHSHAWGGTPLYSLPKALLGLEIVKPGLAEINLNPSLLGLQKAMIELPTKYGFITCRLEKGKAPIISHPAEITVNLKKCIKKLLQK